MQTFLLLDEKNMNSPSFGIREKDEPDSDDGKRLTDNDDIQKNNFYVKIGSESSDNDGLIISSINAKWIDNQTFNTLENINLIVKPEQSVAIIGPVGAGKV